LADPLITSPIIGPNSLDQLKDNLGALAISLSADEKVVLDKATAWKVENEA
jgi:aryl-alcohol dehydrogenase-like predicted oxidoreductase